METPVNEKRPSIPANNAAENFRVVCLAGSAGGLEAYIDILRSMPVDTGMAFVIAPHRGPENADLLPKILAAVTKMPIVDVEDGTALEPNMVFVIPPRRDMTVNGNVLLLQHSTYPVITSRG